MYSICGVNDSTIAIGTNKQGLFFYNHLQDSLRHFTISQGMESNEVQEMVKDRWGHLWGLTPKGLFAYLPQEDRIVFLTTKDGETSSAVSSSNEYV